jgi:hypothetical protein
MKNVRTILDLPKENKNHRVAAYSRVAKYSLVQLRNIDIHIETR